MSDEPIDEPGFVAGVTVVDIGDIRVSRGLTRRPTSSCTHRRMTYDHKERRIWCRDCEKDVDPFDAFVKLTEQYHFAFESLQQRRKELDEAERFQCRSIAAKELDKAWRHKQMVPACPHCGNGLFPEQFKNGIGMLGKDYALAKLKRKAE